MALADLLALARRPAPTPEPVTPVTRNPFPTGYRVEAQKTEEIRQFQVAVTPVTPVTPTSYDVGVDKRAALAAKAAEGEHWIEAYKRDALKWLLQAMGEAGAASGATESDGPLWPDPGTPERERLDRKNAAIVHQGPVVREGISGDDTDADPFYTSVPQVIQ